MKYLLIAKKVIAEFDNVVEAFLSEKSINLAPDCYFEIAVSGDDLPLEERVFSW